MKIVNLWRSEKDGPTIKYWKGGQWKESPPFPPSIYFVVVVNVRVRFVGFAPERVPNQPASRPTKRASELFVCPQSPHDKKRREKWKRTFRGNIFTGQKREGGGGGIWLLSPRQRASQSAAFVAFGVRLSSLFRPTPGSPGCWAACCQPAPADGLAPCWALLPPLFLNFSIPFFCSQTTS